MLYKKASAGISTSIAIISTGFWLYDKGGLVLDERVTLEVLKGRFLVAVVLGGSAAADDVVVVFVLAL